mmetsp:Transcript_35041/g.34061  ORF Transcript_35041/g.34061 Transcript_35041/m.34061 type:complete len:240 (-) Transcript_35041:57-776(-)
MTLNVNMKVFFWLIGFGLAMVFIAGIGVTASLSKNQCLSFLYGYLAMSVMLIFVGAGISMVILKNQIGTYINESCFNEAGFFYEIDKVYSDGKSTLCSPSCPCIANSTLWPGDDMLQISYSKGGADSLDDCTTSSLTSQQKNNLMPLLQALETDFNCAGMCQVSPLYLFSNVNRGPPTKDCKDIMIEEFKKNGGSYSAILLVIGFTGFIGFGLSFAICYMRPKRLMGLRKNKAPEFERL